MNLEQRTEVAEKLFDDSISTLESKGRAYATTGDSLANFKEVGKDVGITKYQAWLVYFLKHVESVKNAIINTPDYPIDDSEGMYSRLIDIVSYAAILAALMKEDEKDS